MGDIKSALITGIVIAIATFFLDKFEVENKFYYFIVYFILFLLVSKILSVIENNKSKRA